jgi:EAL domain-containing protein (putative c-di-GMP-specific phosphodiesterase class I)
MHNDIKRRLDLEKQLRLALKQRELSVHYQPIWTLKDIRPVGFEALLRWQDDGKMKCPPSEFIPVAEETGLIVHIDRWLIHSVCQQIKAWQELCPQITQFNFNINLSSKDFASEPCLVDSVRKILEATNMDANCLRFEITESAIMENIDNVADKVARLRDMGIKSRVIFFQDHSTEQQPRSLSEKSSLHDNLVHRSEIISS